MHMDTGGAIAGEYALHSVFDQLWENANKGVRFLSYIFPPVSTTPHGIGSYTHIHKESTGNFRASVARLFLLFPAG